VHLVALYFREKVRLPSLFTGKMQDSTLSLVMWSQNFDAARNGRRWPYNMKVPKSKEIFFSPAESAAWLQDRLGRLNIETLQSLADKSGIDKGTLSRYFRHERRPSIDCIGPLCSALKTSPELLLKVLGAIPK
jgi:transcriptional regulator with XRE-family HTH domain